jgi:hypothetical protein
MTKRWWFSLCLFAGVLFSGMSTASAAKAVVMPEGSYVKSCKKCTFDGVVLACSCKNKAGKWKQALLSRHCKTSVSNCDGKLTCGSCKRSGFKTRPTSLPMVRLFPRGSYRRTCTRCRLSKTHLICDCTDRKGGWVSSAVALSCKNVVSNCNGQLTCGPICPFRNAKPCIVPLIWMPVCGANGVTYSNKYAAKCASVRVVHEGKCRPRTRPARRLNKQKLLIPRPLRLLRKKPCVCTFLLAPVCGVDGKTYSNACLARCAGVKVKQKGRCK